MSIGGLMDASSPYVHSNIYHLIGSVRDFFSEDSTSKTAQEVESTIEIFKEWIKQLQNYEQELYSFCGVADFQSLNEKLFGTGQTTQQVAKIAHMTILESGVIQKLTPKISKAQMTKILSNFQKIPINSIFTPQENELDLTEVRSRLVGALASALKEGGNWISKDFAIETIVGPSEGGKDGIKQALEQSLSTWIGKAQREARSRGSKMRQLSDAILKTGMSFNISFNDFEVAFLPRFLERLKEARIPILAEEDLSQLASDYTKKIYHLIFEGKNFTQLQSILGERGENMLEFAVDESNLKMEIKIIGSETEEQIKKDTENFLMGVSGDIEMANYNLGSGDKLSKSDAMIKIESPSGIKIFRVQSKDALLTQLEKASFGDSVYQTVHMLENSVLQILQMLSERTIIGQDSIDTLAYYIANMVWFLNAGSYERVGKGEDSFTTTTRTRGSGETAGLWGVQEAINSIISQGIQAFIGMTINEKAQEGTPLELSATNIFYFLGARALFPVSEVLKAAVAQMEGLKEQLFSLRFVINTSGVAFSYNDAKNFWEAKARAVEPGHLSGSAYEDAGLLSIGKSQGAAIMGSVSGRINFTFDIGKILQLSSYVF